MNFKILMLLLLLNLLEPPASSGYELRAIRLAENESAACSNKSRKITEERALLISKAEILNRMGAEKLKGYSEYVVDFESATERWMIIAMPESRVIGGQLHIAVDSCGKVVQFKGAL